MTTTTARTPVKTRPRARPRGELTFCNASKSTTRIDPDRNHDWRDLEPTRLRLDGEDDQKFACARCGRLRFLQPPPTPEHEAGATVAMPPGFPSLTLSSVGYDVEASPGQIPALTRIQIVENTPMHRTVSISFKGLRQFYPAWIERAYRDRHRLPEDYNLGLKDFNQLALEAVARLAELCSGDFPISEYLLSEPALIDMCRMSEKDNPGDAETNPRQWEYLPIQPAQKTV